MKILKSGITSPKGFSAIGKHIGIKKVKKDLCILKSDVPAIFAGSFTKNVVKAAPVIWDMELLNKNQNVMAIVVNSGNANACTGEQGEKDNYLIAQTTAKKIGCDPTNVLVCSTGVIGVNLPMDIVVKGINETVDKLNYSQEAAESAAEAIMTTDTFAKTISVEIILSGKPVRISAMAKGSGMIHPNMATMLSFVVTDVNISSEMLKRVQKQSVRDSYNMISVDGDTSTNDTSLIMANAMADNEKIQTENQDYRKFKQALDFVNKKLAIMIAKDGEGATKLMEVTVKGSIDDDNARKIAKSVVSSNLFKAALFGADANWGRVLCAMGYSGGDFNPNDVTIKFSSVEENNVASIVENPLTKDLDPETKEINFENLLTRPNGIADEITLMEKGVPIKFDEQKAKNILSRPTIFIDILLNGGNATAKAWGCDLTYDYVKINGDYRS